MRYDTLGRPIRASSHAHKTRHGMFGTRIYEVWDSMKRRCLTPTNTGYPRYGGRGITVCKRWYKFENFYADMGDIPKGMSLDRIDNDGNYEPSNCRWATPKQQRHNQRKGRLILVTYKGETMPRKDWAKRLSISVPSLKHRLANWPIERALSVPKYQGRRY